MYINKLSIHMLLLALSSSIGYAECKFPNPCGQMLKQHETIVSSQKNREKIQSQNFSDSSLDWAWEKLFHQITYGGKRLNTEIPQGIPVGDVFSATTGLKVDVNVRILSFEIAENERVVWSINNPSAPFYIPNTILKSGKSYTWEAAVEDSGDRYDLKEDFRILDEKESRIVQMKQTELAKEFLDQTTRDFALAVFCFDSGYEYNGDLILKNLLKGKE